MGNCVSAYSQVKITDGSVFTMDANSILELESPDKGLLIPRVKLNDITLPAPLTAPVPVGMLVFSNGGDINDGFYYWNGTLWRGVNGNGPENIKTYTISADDTIPKSNCIVFAENSITLTLPQVTSADTGMIIRVKNVGSHTNQIIVEGYSGVTIDNVDSVRIRPQQGKTFVARGENWELLNRVGVPDDVIDVGPDASFKTLSDAIDFLGMHMTAPTVIRLGGDIIYLSETQVIDLPYPLTIQGFSYGTGIIAPAAGLEGKPMFRCLSDCSFKMLIFDGTYLAGYGTSPGEDAIRLAGSGTYNEIKDSSFDNFYNAILDSTDAELWLFECDVTNSYANGLLMHSAIPGAVVKVSETDFTYCKRSLCFSKGSDAMVQVMTGVFTNMNSNDTAFVYRPQSFSFSSMIISNNTINSVGVGISGFDFSRPDGRDANAFIENNAGIGSNKPHAKINVVNNSQTVTCALANSWYKANWTNTSIITTNLAINNNRFVYQPVKPRDIFIIVSGNVLVNSQNRVITIAMVKNGNKSDRYGETTLRITVANQPFQFSTVIYIEDVEPNDYFELFCSSLNSGDVLTFQDINWFVNSE